ncbi:MAG: protein TolQ [Alphaproteobacteria bacterium]|nr:protein TolQ [Alphaproteobacteria bacterium]
MEAAGPDLSIAGLFLQADPIVKAVMVALAVASIWSWAVAIDKWMQFGDLKKRADAFEKRFWSGATLEDLDDGRGEARNDALARVFAVGVREWRDMRRSAALNDTQAALLTERVDRLMQAQIAREAGDAGRGLGVLASVGSAAPFVGLFGTVWGIMNSFASIAAAKETNLSVVAPGIAEALFATAMGLAAAIPAVIFYNAFAGDLEKFTDRLETFADECAARISRRLSERVG